MHDENIKTGDRIEIYSKDSKASSRFFVSKVEQVFDRYKMSVHVPISFGKLIKLPENKLYSFLFFTERGMLRVDAVITDYFVEDGFYLMNVRLHAQPERFQRREFFRFECAFRFQIGVVDDTYDIARDLPRPVMFDCITKDISAGGVRFMSVNDIELNARVKCVMHLGTDLFFTLGKILQKQELTDSKMKFQYRIMFLDLTDSEKEKIVKYIFVEQRKALRSR